VLDHAYDFLDAAGLDPRQIVCRDVVTTHEIDLIAREGHGGKKLRNDGRMLPARRRSADQTALPVVEKLGRAQQRNLGSKKAFKQDLEDRGYGQRHGHGADWEVAR